MAGASGVRPPPFALGRRGRAGERRKSANSHARPVCAWPSSRCAQRPRPLRCRPLGLRVTCRGLAGDQSPDSGGARGGARRSRFGLVGHL